ncbi:MAG: DUF3857 domain-containing protein [Candidatus Eisenbacteria bacterium]|nr:DUF3857 domain-containing protein [Candidatus Eisenbacteria bacterium]
MGGCALPRGARGKERGRRCAMRTPGPTHPRSLGAAVPRLRDALPGCFALAAMALVLACAGAPALGAPLDASGDYDIGALLREADAEFDLAQQDAVVLLKRQDLRIAPDGARRTTVHRIVWMRTELAMETYADLRVPYRSDRAELEVHTLRTWRDERWWPDSVRVSPTAVVETLPGAVAGADAYTALRETMLLHDGVELPCIVETRYTISEAPPLTDDLARAGARITGLAAFAHDGLWRFAQHDPVVRSELRITVPDESSLQQISRSGAAGLDTSQSRRVEGGHLYVWHMRNVPRIPQPTPADPLQVTPHVVWSRWPSWETLGRIYHTAFESAARLECPSLGRVLCDSLRAAIAREPGPRAVAGAVADFIGRWTRHVGADADFWALQPRSALRTWETAYGHAYDRAVLAAALFREAGLQAEPMLRSRGRGEIAERIPALSWFGPLLVRVRAAGPSGGIESDYEGIYDPAHGTLQEGLATAAGYTIWIPGENPQRIAAPQRGHLQVSLRLEPGEEEQWTGQGYLRASGGLAPHAAMTGLGTQAQDHLAAVAGVIEGAELRDHNVSRLQPDRVVAGFEFGWKEPEPDDHGRVRLSLGEPAGGVLAQLPSDVSLFDEDRESPVLLPFPMTQTLELWIKVGEEAERVVYVPEAYGGEHSLGTARLAVEQEGDWLHLTREIAIVRAEIAARTWPQLRALLLRETLERNRVVLLEAE